MLQSGLPHIIDFKMNEIDACRFNEVSLDFDVQANLDMTDHYTTDFCL